MKDFKRVEDLVRDVLERIPEARKDDSKLTVNKETGIYFYADKFGIDDVKKIYDIVNGE